MSQKDITLRQGHASPKTVILRPLEAAPASPTTTVYLYEFHATPKTVVLGDPTVVRETGGAATYEFTGSVALTLGVASPQTVSYAEAVSIAVTFGVASAQAAVYAEPAGVALAFGGDSAFEFVAAPVVEPADPPIAGGGGGTAGYRLWGDKRHRLTPAAVARQYIFEGDVRFSSRWVPRSPVMVFYAEPAEAGIGTLAASAAVAVTVTPAVNFIMSVSVPSSPMHFTVTPTLDEWLIIDPDDWLGAILNEDELALGGVS